MLLSIIKKTKRRKNRKKKEKEKEKEKRSFISLLLNFRNPSLLVSDSISHDSRHVLYQILVILNYTFIYLFIVCYLC